MEAQKRKLRLIFRECMIISDYFIESNKRRGKDSSFDEMMKENLLKGYTVDKENTKLLSRNISGYRMALKDLYEMVRISLKKEEQAELKRRIRDELGPDIE